MKVEEYAALYKLSMLPGEKLPGIAIELIESGVDSQALMDLAWEDKPTLGTASQLFEKGLNDIGVIIPERGRALLLLTNLYCKQVLSGELSPYEGAHNIWQRVCLDDNPPECALEFVTLADALQNDASPKSVEYFSSQIIEEAKKVVATVNV